MTIAKSMVDVFEPGVSERPPAAPAPPAGWTKEAHGCLEAPSLWYYDRGRREPPSIYKYLIGQARELIRVWDSYVHEPDAALFSGVPIGVRLEVLTYEGVRPPSEPRVTRFKRALDRFALESTCDVRFVNSRMSQGTPFHDRYLFVDEEVFKVGASLEYHHTLGNPSHAVLRVENREARALLRDRFLHLWRHPHTESVS